MAAGDGTPDYHMLCGDIIHENHCFGTTGTGKPTVTLLDANLSNMWYSAADRQFPLHGPSTMTKVVAWLADARVGSQASLHKRWVGVLFHGWPLLK